MSGSIVGRVSAQAFSQSDNSYKNKMRADKQDFWLAIVRKKIKTDKDEAAENPQPHLYSWHCSILL
jgi:hypothetical protein